MCQFGAVFITEPSSTILPVSPMHKPLCALTPHHRSCQMHYACHKNSAPWDYKGALSFIVDGGLMLLFYYYYLFFMAEYVWFHTLVI